MYIDTRTGVDVTNHITSSNTNHRSGLHIQARNGQCVPIPIPTNCCAYQIGETAQIMSGGLLQATPHAVFPPSTVMHEGSMDANYISRESFALFLEPEFEDVLQSPSSSSRIEDCCCGSSDTVTNRLGLRPISERYQVGQTFGDFHLATVSTNATAP
jgi:isopenicillin N synthase-like dioxygenase